MNAKSIQMLSCFFQEEFLAPATLFCGELFLHHLISRAAQDPRFQAIGLEPLNGTYDPTWRGLGGHQARMAFLGITKLSTMMRSFRYPVDAQDFLLREMYKAQGKKVAAKDRWSGYPHPWPDVKPSDFP